MDELSWQTTSRLIRLRIVIVVVTRQTVRHTVRQTMGNEGRKQ